MLSGDSIFDPCCRKLATSLSAAGDVDFLVGNLEWEMGKGRSMRCVGQRAKSTCKVKMELMGGRRVRESSSVRSNAIEDGPGAAVRR